MIRVHRQTLRTFFHSLLVAAGIAIVILFGGHRNWCTGFVIGALTSLLSLLSLKICVPALFHKGATPRATALLHILLIMKVPVYAIGLYFAAKMGAGAAFAAFTGCALVPSVVTLETVAKAIMRSNARWKRALIMREPIAILPAVEELSRHVAELKAGALEVQAGSTPPRTVREGAV